MSTYHMTVSGSNTLAKIQNALRGEEALASEFQRSQLTAVDGTITNLVTFEEAGAIPAALKLQAGGTAAPAGGTLVWSGVMLVSGSNAMVDVYRMAAP
ncbi:MAG: hypothetical protein KF796_14255 [Ramlibacter sp.]|nr:hypothetical protein [Ramlibacter sp.]